MLLLDLAGVSAEYVAADYALSSERRPSLRHDHTEARSLQSAARGPGPRSGQVRSRCGKRVPAVIARHPARSCATAGAARPATWLGCRKRRATPKSTTHSGLPASLKLETGAPARHPLIVASEDRAIRGGCGLARRGLAFLLPWSSVRAGRRLPWLVPLNGDARRRDHVIPDSTGPREYHVTARAASRERYSFGNLKEILELPDLISIQRDSFSWLMSQGLARTFRDISPISDYSETLRARTRVRPRRRGASSAPQVHGG